MLYIEFSGRFNRKYKIPGRSDFESYVYEEHNFDTGEITYLSICDEEIPVLNRDLVFQHLLWKANTEGNFAKLHFYVDGNGIARLEENIDALKAVNKFLDKIFRTS